MSADKRILIAGAGIAGPSLALLLRGSGFKITIIEKASQFRRSGQQIDVSGVGIGVVKHLGLYETIKSRTTGDAGVRFVDSADRTMASFAADPESDASFVKEIEIMRGDLADILYDSSKPDTEYIFGDSISALKEESSGITVSFEKGADRSFDLVVAADGLGSKTRDIAFGKSAVKIKSYNQVLAWLTIPYEESDGNWSTWYNAPGGLLISLRPRPKDRKSGGYMGITGPGSQGIAKLSVPEQKKEFARRFAGAGYQTERVLQGMMRDDSDFYVQETAQVHMPRWVNGRVALLGDAGYCPSPISGQGTTLAFTGAYVLAGCLTSSPDNIVKALSDYEEQVRPFVKQAQGAIPPGAPAIANPQTALGIRLFNTVLFVVSTAVAWGIGTPLGWFASPLNLLFGSKELGLPHYAALDKLRSN